MIYNFKIFIIMQRRHCLLSKLRQQLEDCNWSHEAVRSVSHYKNPSTVVRPKPILKEPGSSEEAHSIESHSISCASAKLSISSGSLKGRRHTINELIGPVIQEQCECNSQGCSSESSHNHSNGSFSPRMGTCNHGQKDDLGKLKLMHQKTSPLMNVNESITIPSHIRLKN